MNIVELWQEKSNTLSKELQEKYENEQFEINKKLSKEKIENIKQFYMNEKYDCTLRDDKLLIKMKNRNATLDVTYTRDIGEANLYCIGAVAEDSDLTQSDIYSLYDDTLLLEKETDVLTFIKQFEEEIIWKNY